jgi:hypothetical protein
MTNIGLIVIDHIDIAGVVILEAHWYNSSKDSLNTRIASVTLFYVKKN